ncbi:MAG: MaoC family dehydratase [Lachnospiraceae bacterium]|nr:MaoC family dehydratase [Lachnospiraceae bacterium]
MNHYRYEEIEIGQKESFRAQVTEEDMQRFLAITGDDNPLHNKEEYAKEQGHRGRVVYGMLTASYLSALAGVYLPGERSLIHSVEIKLNKPVYIGDILTVEGEVTEKNDTFQLLIVKVIIRNQEGEKVLKGKMQIGVS